MALLDRFVDRGAQKTSNTQKRIRNIPTGDLATWVDNTISQVGRSTRAYFTSGEHEHLDEAKLGAESLLEMIAELERRGGAE